MNDLPSAEENRHVKLFADDTKIYKTIVENCYCDELQSDVHKLSASSKNGN